MRTNTLRHTSTFALAALLAFGGLSACKSKKKAAEAAMPDPTGETEVIRCSAPVRSSSPTKRTSAPTAFGESMDQATAMKKAMSNARADHGQRHQYPV
jgi:hypothetical protein